MKITIDRDLCIGCELCASLAADVFSMDEDDKAEVTGEITEENKDDVCDSISSCPTEAIIKED
ncbi:MAG: ferredoxin [Elusimicrobiota bacterium]|nr:ferredoxin [Elusimicrobiota bacterium]